MNGEQKNFLSNRTEFLRDFQKPAFEQEWVKHNTAILVVHGIGQQRPLETLDQFCRTLVSSYKEMTACELVLEHAIMHRTNGKFGWVENYIIIRHPLYHTTIDVYEYYWAHLTENAAKITDVQNWFRDTIKGARKFYKRNARLGYKSQDKSLFFDKKGRFNYFRYRFFLFVTALLIPGLTLLGDLIFKVLGNIRILGIGTVFSFLLEQLGKSKFGMVTNVIGDITVYNTSDEKSKFYEIRRNILNGAVDSLQNLLEPGEDQELKYRKVFIAGHSLGSQIAFDSINRVNIMINLNRWWGYDQDGYFTSHPDTPHISEILSGLITFGSPLDKIAFFLREHIGDKEYIRLQLLNHYHCFKQRSWSDDLGDEPMPGVRNPIRSHLDQMPWRNYYDNRDYVSGGLDYYFPLVNINCRFKSRMLSFTHSHYWNSSSMFQDIWVEMILSAPSG